MELIAQILCLTGAFIFFVGYAWIIVTACKHSLWWGLGCQILAFVPYLFLILHRQKAAKLGLATLVGVGLLAAGAAIMPVSG